jgi:hypothetical protein
MKKIFLTLWLLLPILLVTYHYGPGQDRLKQDDVSMMLQAADHYVAVSNWGKAIELFDNALTTMPKDEVLLNRRVRLAKAKAQMDFSQLPVANRDLQSLMDEVLESSDSNTELSRDIRSALANSQYYMTWLMRLEGLPEDKWMPEIESARQNYKLLAEESIKQGNNDSKLKTHREDLESAILLARMDLGELQGLPLPSQ